MAVANAAGHVLTFYSYKGGTGRSMAVANIGCLLAKENTTNKVLLIDWDLEAPGLHTFFENYLHREASDHIEQIDNRAGLIELFLEFDRLTQDSVWATKEEPPPEVIANLFQQVNLDNYTLETDIQGLYLIKAGRFDDNYQSKINTFGWEKLFNRMPWFFTEFAEFLTSKYDYVLIDSRTGVADTSNICTTLLPEKLVVVFRPNHQSLTGILSLIKSATRYRRNSADLRPLTVFPLPSIIEVAQEGLRQTWRYGDPNRRIEGYQKQFETLFQETYKLPECNLTNYFDQVQIQHDSHYAYGEEIAVLVDPSTTDKLSLSFAYKTFLTRLLHLSGPWEQLSPELEPDVVLSRAQRLAQNTEQVDLETAPAVYRSLDHLLLGVDRFFQRLFGSREEQRSVSVGTHLKVDRFFQGLFGSRNKLGWLAVWYIVLIVSVIVSSVALNANLWPIRTVTRFLLLATIDVTLGAAISRVPRPPIPRRAAMGGILGFLATLAILHGITWGRGNTTLWFAQNGLDGTWNSFYLLVVIFLVILLLFGMLFLIAEIENRRRQADKSSVITYQAFLVLSAILLILAVVLPSGLLTTTH